MNMRQIKETRQRKAKLQSKEQKKRNIIIKKRRGGKKETIYGATSSALLCAALSRCPRSKNRLFPRRVSK
jgi:hypothetical protein